MSFEALKSIIRINNDLIEAEARKRHSEARLTELWSRRCQIPAYVDRVAEDIYEADREIERLRAKLEEVSA